MWTVSTSFDSTAVKVADRVLKSRQASWGRGYLTAVG
jgi:hypothetical protein